MEYLDERIYEHMDKKTADKIWKIREEEYDKLYALISNSLSREFKREYEKCYFHDYSINAIAPQKNEDFTYSLIVTLKHKKEIFEITYENVKMFKCNIGFGDSLYMVDLLQSEILPADDNCISHEFTLTGNDYSFIHIVCRNIGFKKISK